MDPQSKEGRTVIGYENYAKTFIALGAVCFLIAIVLFLLKIPGKSISLPINPDAFAAFGNLASGSVGLFWSLAGIILFYGALRLQRVTLQEQRDEFIESTRILQFQKFDSTFFNLLNQHNEIVNAITVTSATAPPRTVTGRECFATLYNYVWGYITRVGASQGGVPNRDLDLERTLDHYQDWWEREEPRAGHYFRNLYNLIKLIDRNDNMMYEEKKTYTNIVRAQLSSYELLLLFYNCLSSYGSEKFKPLVEKYHLLKTVPGDKLINERHRDAYDLSAFE